MKDNFQHCLALTLQYEGGWSDDPHDPGGATMKGVTLAVYEQFKGRSATKDELRHISDADLEAIYRTGYWDKMRCDDLPKGVDMVAFDAAVNSGPKRSAQWLQRAAMVADDGQIGPQTIKALNSLNPHQVVNAALDNRLKFLRGLDNFTRYGRGWTDRVARVRAEALA